jgi:hypothetical protein
VIAVGVLLALALAGATVLALIEKRRVRVPEAAKHWVWAEDQEALNERAMRLFPELQVAVIVTPTTSVSQRWPEDRTLELTEGGKVLLRVGVWELGRAGGGASAMTGLARDENLVLVAEFSPISTGCSISAYDLRSGEKVWQKALEGLGPIDHSKYSNRVQMEVIDRVLVVRGWEAAGRYIECLSVSDGRKLSNEKLGLPKLK